MTATPAAFAPGVRHVIVDTETGVYELDLILGRGTYLRIADEGAGSTATPEAFYFDDRHIECAVGAPMHLDITLDIFGDFAHRETSNVIGITEVPTA